MAVVDAQVPAVVTGAADEEACTIDYAQLTLVMTTNAACMQTACTTCPAGMQAHIVSTSRRPVAVIRAEPTQMPRA